MNTGAPPPLGGTGARPAARALVALVALVVCACGGDEGTVAVTEPTVGAEGGTVTSPDGKVNLIVPAGALSAPAAITIRPAAPLSHARLIPGSEYVFEPDGLEFGVPASLTIRLDSVPAALADQIAYIWLHRRVGVDFVAVAGEPFRAGSLEVRGEITGFSNYGGATSQLAADLLLAGQQLDAFLTDAVAENAIALLTTIASLLLGELDPAWQGLVQPFLDQVVIVACNAYSSAVGNARDAPVDDWGVFTALLEPVYAWAATAARAGALDGCPNAPLTVEQIQDLKFQQFVDFYVGKLDPAGFGQNFDQLLDEVRFVAELRGNAQSLGMTAVDQRLETDAQHPLMRALRVSAYQSCRDEGRHEYLGRLRVHVAASDYTDDELLTDLQQCATRLTWRVRAEDQSLDATGTLGGGASPGTETAQAATAGVAKGTITLGGDVRAFRCPDGSFAPDELVVTLDGAEVDRRQATGGSFYPSPHELDAETVLEAAGVDPYAIATIPLVIARESPNFGCALYTQSMEAIPLVTLNLGFPAPFAYFEDFDGAAGPEWSSQQIAVAPVGERFLGLLNSESVTLTLSDLPAHQEVVIELDLHVIGSWDGNGNYPGGDYLRFRSGSLDFLATFSNDDGDEQAYPQAYPASNPRGSGAMSVNTLGYGFSSDESDWEDSTYRVSFTISHALTTFSFTVTGTMTSTGDEFWGLDNVRVKVQ